MHPGTVILYTYRPTLCTIITTITYALHLYSVSGKTAHCIQKFCVSSFLYSGTCLDLLQLSASADFLLCLIFDPEDEGSMFLLNFELHQTYTAYKPEECILHCSSVLMRHMGFHSFNCLVALHHKGVNCIINFASYADWIVSVDHLTLSTYSTARYMPSTTIYRPSHYSVYKEKFSTINNVSD